MKNSVTIIFSKNRAMQLTLCLETLLNHCSDILDLSDIYVLYKVDPSHRESYETVKKEFPTINFVEETIFKEDLLKIVHNESNVLFLTDDSCFVEDFSIEECLTALNGLPTCLGFSLRLGENTKYCFSLDTNQEVPMIWNTINNNILIYKWTDAQYDFGYPLELSSSIYKIEDIIEILENCSYNSPNSLESLLASCYLEGQPYLMMFKKSVCFSMPLNLVQSTHPNRSANFDLDTFRRLYEKGIRIDSKQFNGYISNGAHEIPKEINMVDKK